MEREEKCLSNVYTDRLSRTAQHERVCLHVWHAKSKARVGIYR